MSSTTPATASTTRLQETPVATARRIAVEYAAPHADSVDEQARFPIEAVEALRAAGLLSAYIPEALEGGGVRISDLAAITQALAERCAAVGMIYAMHQIQVACLVHHSNGIPFFRAYLKTISEQQLLLASITSELGVGGSIRTSIAALLPGSALCRLQKNATTISYGDYADGFLATCRRTPEASASDQVLVLLQRSQMQMQPTGQWNTLGMRGTCSPGYCVEADFPAEQCLPVPFGDICTRTMTPFSHILWSACWLGIATDATARARASVRAKARKAASDGPMGDVRLAEATRDLQLMRVNLQACLGEYQTLLDANDLPALSSFDFAIRINNLKTASSELVVKIVAQAMAVTGMAGYRNDTPYSLGRHLRDAHSAAAMIGNDRLYTTNAGLLLMSAGTGDARPERAAHPSHA